MTELQLYPNDGERLDDLLAKSAQARALTDIVKDAQKAVDSRLLEAVEQVSGATGTAFTARRDGWTAVVTDPQPRPRVTDSEAFSQWWNEHIDFVDIETWVALTVSDTKGLLELLAHHQDGMVSAESVLSCLSSVTEYVLPEDPFTPLIDSGRIKVTGDAVIDSETGEIVPGTTVSIAAPVLQVRGSKDAKAQARRQVAATIGLPPELAGGAA